MAVEGTGLAIGFEAADADFTTKQFLCGKFTATGVAVCSVAGERVDGIIQDTPTLGDAVNLKTDGPSKAYAGAAFAKGADLQVDATGRLITATSTKEIAAVALEAASAAGNLVTVQVKARGIKA